MAVVLTAPVAQENVADFIKKLDTELQFLLDGADVPPEVQANIAECGIVSTSIFACIEVDVKEFRDFVKTGLTIDSAGSIPNKVVTAKLINAWEASVTRGRKRREEEAEQRIGDLPRKLPRTSHLELNKAFMKAHGEPKDSETPHPAYVEAKLQQLEDGMLLTETMAEIVSVKDDDDVAPPLGVVLQPDGKLRARRTALKKGSEPKTTEDLRTKFRIVAHMWELLRLRLPGKSYLIGYDMRLWEKYVEYLLGERVYGIDTKSVVSADVCKPPWSLVLEYDVEFRKRFAWAFNNKDGTLETFMKFAYDDTAVYQVRFLSPLSISAGTAAAKAAAEAAGSSGARAVAAHGPPPSPAANPGGRSRGKGASKGKAGSDPAKSAAIRANQICYKYQKGKCTDARCERRHVCIQCDSASHGAKDCKAKSAGGKGGKR